MDDWEHGYERFGLNHKVLNSQYNETNRQSGIIGKSFRTVVIWMLSVEVWNCKVIYIKTSLA